MTIFFLGTMTIIETGLVESVGQFSSFFFCGWSAKLKIIASFLCIIYSAYDGPDGCGERFQYIVGHMLH